MKKNEKHTFFRNCYFIFLLFATFFISQAIEALQVNNLSSIQTLTPGEKKQVQVRLINENDASEQVDLKLVDYTCNDDGQHFFNESALNDVSARQPRSNLGWVRLGQDRVTLEPHEERDIYYELEAPTDPCLNGSYWSVLLIEPASITSAKNPDQKGLQINVKIRYGHHIVTNIGEGAPKIKILKKEIQEVSGIPYLCIHVVNEGNLYFNPTLTVRLYDKEGKLEKTLGPCSDRLYPGNPQCFFLSLQELPENRRAEKLTGFILFDGGKDLLFMDRFTHP